MEIQLLKEIAGNYPDEIRYPFDCLFRRAGFESLYAMIEEFGGSNIYVPTARSIFYECIVRQMQTQYNGLNFRELCKHYGLTETTARRMLSR